MFSKQQYTISLGKLLILVVSIGGLSAVVIFWFLYIYAIPLNLPEIDNLVLRPKRVVINTEFPADIVKEDALHMFASIYKKASIHSLVYVPSDIQGYAVSITTDGWFIATMHSEDILPLSQFQNYTIIGSSGKKYAILQSFFDEVSDLYFIKTDASEFTPIRFAEDVELPYGSEVFVSCASGTSLGRYQSLEYDRIVTYRDLVKSSDKLNRKMRISVYGISDVRDCGVLDKDGRLLALSSTHTIDGLFIPVQSIVNIIPSVLKNEAIPRASLGLLSIDLSEVLFTDTSVLPPRQDGAYIYNFGLQSIERGSAAEKAGFRERDIITHVANEKISKRRTLSEILSEYHTGDTVSFEVLRGGQILSISATLQ